MEDLRKLFPHLILTYSSWFYQTFVDIFKGTITHIIQNAVQTELTNIMNEIGSYIEQQTPVTYKINSNLMLDYSLTQQPYISTTYSATLHSGWFSIGITLTLQAILCGFQQEILAITTALTFLMI